MNQKVRSLGEPNILYVFTDDTSKIHGIYIDFQCINKMMFINKDFDGICDYSTTKDNKRVMRITNGSDIYEITPDKVESIYINSCEKQIREFIFNLTKLN